METPRRTWRRLDDVNVILTGDGCDASQSIMVKDRRHTFETDADFPVRIVDDAQLFVQVLVELIANDLDDLELAGFLRLQLDPVREALVGQWKWTTFVRSAARREVSPWSDSQGMT